MYIVAIAWMYVTLLMAATEKSITAGVLTFVFYGLLPCLLFIWLFSTPQRKRNKARKEANATNLNESTEPILCEPDRANTKTD
jgi:biotin transporter BioY